MAAVPERPGAVAEICGRPNIAGRHRVLERLAQRLRLRSVLAERQIKFKRPGARRADQGSNHERQQQAGAGADSGRACRSRTSRRPQRAR